jgi:hypothetical protein
MRSEMEAGFGHDLTQVRIHTDDAAARSAAVMRASAYTIGNHIFFARNRFQHTNSAAKHLLAHELAHVLQQQRGGMTDPSAPGQHEHHAAAAAHQVLNGHTHVGVGAGTRVGVARSPDDEPAPVDKPITGKQEGSGELLKKPVEILGHTYVYVIWGQWQNGDNVDSFRKRVIPKWVTWRFRGIEPAQREAVIAYLHSKFVRFNPGALTPGNCYSLPLEDVVFGQARILSGEPDREKAAKQAKDEQAGGGGDGDNAAKQSPGGLAGAADKTDKDKSSAPGAGDPAGEKSAPVSGNPDVLASNAALAQLYVGFLERYAGVKADRNQAARGLTRAQVTAIIAGNDRAKVVTDIFTQSWVEYQATGGTDVIAFGLMEETLFTQRDRGNFTALHNQLQISKDPEGLGLYKRGTGLRYYDAAGQPVPTNVGGYRDPGYRAAAPPTHAAQIPITDRGLLQILSGIKNVTLDDQVLIYESAKGFYDNGDLLFPAVREGWDGWSAVNAELQRQLPVLVFFLGLEGIATVLKKSQDPKAKGAGLLLEAMLKAAGKFFKFVFIGEIADSLYRCGLELSKIQRSQGGTDLDALSQEHLSRAAVLMRQLLTTLLAAGLSAAIIATARSTAVTLSPPPGGGGLVPAPATGASPRGAAAVPAPPGYRGPSVVPRLPSEFQSGGSGDGGREAPKKKAPKATEADQSTQGDQEPAKADPRATEKANLQKQLDAARERRLQVFTEIEEASRPGEQQPSKAEREELQREGRQAAAEAEKLRKKLADLETTLYGKARTYSYSDAAERDVLSRSRGLDEMSGTKVKEPSIDHVVPIAEIVEFDGWSELAPEDQQQILSRRDNLRMMEKSLNSSKGQKRWANWEAGRRAYGQEVWSRMVETENALRQAIRDDIKERVSRRRR